VEKPEDSQQDATGTGMISVRYEAPTAVVVKSSIIWGMTSSTDVSEEYIASIFRVEG
jgi:hypothetical protein